MLELINQNQIKNQKNNEWNMFWKNLQQFSIKNVNKLLQSPGNLSKTPKPEAAL